MNSPKKPASLNEIIKRRQGSDFVGREEQVNLFRQNLSLPLDDDRRRFIFNIWGQGGVGKTYFLKHCRKITEDAQGVTAYGDEDIKDVPALMAQMVKQFEAKGHKFKEFQERYKTFRQKKEQLEADPEAPEGFGALAGKMATKGAFKVAEHIPGADIAVDFVGDKTRDALAEQVGSWTSYVARRLKNKDEVKLVLEPETVLTPLFLQDLNKVAAQGCVGLLFDTYEQTDVYLEEWLLDILEGKYGDIPLNIFFLIAGRNPLNPNLWSGYEGLIAHFPLEKFSKRELQDYLARKEINDVQVREVIENLSGKLPLLIATLAAGTPNSVEALGDPCDTAVERFLRWIEDPQKRKVALNAALLRHLNRDKLAVLVGEYQATSLFAWLKQKPFVLERTDGWAYHDVVRQQMLNYQRRESEKSWQDLHGKFAVYYERRRDSLGLEGKEARQDKIWQSYALEALYHRLCEKPRQFLKTALEGFIDAWQKLSFANRWAKTMQQVGEEISFAEVKKWGERLVAGWQAYDDVRYEEVVEMFTALLRIKPDSKYAITERGKNYRLMECYEEALADFNRAIELDSEYKWAITQRGYLYRSIEHYEEALTEFNRAIEINPEYKWAIRERGVTYGLMKRYEEALADFNQAIELDSEYTWAIALRGYTYHLMKRYEEALADLNRAIELDPEYTWAIALRGITYRLMERYKDALTNLNCAIELNLEFKEAITERGITYRFMECYEEALKDFNRVVEIDSEYKWAIGQRGYTYRLMERYEEALTDFNHAIELDPKYDWAFAERGKTYILMKRYEEALTDFKRAIELDPDECLYPYHLAVAKFRWQRSQAKPEFNAAYQALKAAEKDKPGKAAYGLGGLAALIGKKDLALKYLQKAISLEKQAITWARHDIAWLDLRQDKRFQTLVK